MSRVIFTIACVTFVAGTLASGWWHARFSNRWGRNSQFEVAAAKLGRELPKKFGPWRHIKPQEFEKDVKEALGAAAILSGLYINEQTGDHIVVALLAGPSGPLSVHTPEICYAATDYEVVGDSQAKEVTDRRGARHTYWQLHANSRSATLPNLRVIYAWNRGNEWEATRGPRFALAGVPLVYKLQLAGPPREKQATSSYDPCEDFLSHFLAEIQPRVAPANSRPPDPA
jgi:hypothetical protein